MKQYVTKKDELLYLVIPENKNIIANTIKINISLLDLDTQNPRFLMLYNDSHSQDDIINYLLKNENALEIVRSIYDNKDFFEDSFCYVLEQNGRYIVKEGNRRIAALKALAEPLKYLADLKIEPFCVDSVNCLIYRTF